MSSMFKIMLVDDSECDLFLHQELLLLSGIRCEILSFNFAGDALDYLNCLKDDMIPHIILSDFNMPLMGGLEFLDKINELPYPIQERIDFYLLSASQNIAELNKAKKNSRLKHIFQKPLNVESLIEYIPEVYKLVE